MTWNVDPNGDLVEEDEELEKEDKHSYREYDSFCAMGPVPRRVLREETRQQRAC